jgi:hypothetical protein
MPRLASAAALRIDANVCVGFAVVTDVARDDATEPSSWPPARIVAVRALVYLSVCFTKNTRCLSIAFCLISSASVFCLNAITLLILSQNLRTSREILPAVFLKASISSYINKIMFTVHQDETPIRV